MRQEDFAGDRSVRLLDHGCGEIIGDDIVPAAMIDRLIRHAEILALKGDSYRLRELARPPAAIDLIGQH